MPGTGMRGPYTTSATPDGAAGSGSGAMSMKVGVEASCCVKLQPVREAAHGAVTLFTFRLTTACSGSSAVARPGTLRWMNGMYGMTAVREVPSGAYAMMSHACSNALPYASVCAKMTSLGHPSGLKPVPVNSTSVPPSSDPTCVLMDTTRKPTSSAAPDALAYPRLPTVTTGGTGACGRGGAAPRTSLQDTKVEAAYDTETRRQGRAPNTMVSGMPLATPVSVRFTMPEMAEERAGGAREVMTGVRDARYVKVPPDTPFTTMAAVETAAPSLVAGVRKVSDVGEAAVIVHRTPPTVTTLSAAAYWKPRPVTVTAVPPAWLPLVGATPVSVCTNVTVYGPPVMRA